MAITFSNGFIIGATTALYPFTSFTFTSARVSGSTGPLGTTLLAAYTGSSSGSYFSNPQYFTTGSFQGYQIWTVPQTATYEIEAAGARGGTSTAYSGSLKWGNGAIIKARVPLTQGQKIMMVVGQYSDGNGVQAASWATYHGYGGGGGSFVTLSGSVPTPLVVAGGGGGSGHYSSYAGGAYFTGSNGKTTTSGGPSVQGAPGGTGSMGGKSHINSASVVSTNNYDGGGGGGFNGNGYNGDGTITKPYSATLNAEGGYSFISGAMGGRMATNYTTTLYAGSTGGFGGGGGGNGIIDGGGGGGYSGGGGTYTPSTPGADAGGGGGSYIVSTATSVATSDGNYDGSSTFSGSAITNLSSYNSGGGYIRITKL
jgi:hypothetical protein